MGVVFCGEVVVVCVVNMVRKQSVFCGLKRRSTFWRGLTRIFTDDADSKQATATAIGVCGWVDGRAGNGRVNVSAEASPPSGDDN